MICYRESVSFTVREENLSFVSIDELRITEELRGLMVTILHNINYGDMLEW